MGDPIFRLHGGAAAIDDHALRQTAAFGQERTLKQDPMFVFRILVDIAAKALSKAINDPTTAVLVIDQLHRLLRLVGKRHLHNESLFDSEGRLRAILRTPNWEDFVDLVFWEIRHYGAENMQVARRLRAMGENLIQSLPEHRHAALRQELDLLDRELTQLYVFPEDLALARIADAQGLGGASATHALNREGRHEKKSAERRFKRARAGSRSKRSAQRKQLREKCSRTLWTEWKPRKPDSQSDRTAGPPAPIESPA